MTCRRHVGQLGGTDLYMYGWVRGCATVVPCLVGVQNSCLPRMADRLRDCVGCGVLLTEREARV